jgi:hypothetical protein
MRGARERNVLRWDAHQALLDEEIARLERELAEGSATPESPARAALRQQLEEARRRRLALGPSPRPKMG